MTKDFQKFIIFLVSMVISVPIAFIVSQVIFENFAIPFLVIGAVTYLAMSSIVKIIWKQNESHDTSTRAQIDEPVSNKWVEMFIWSFFLILVITATIILWIMLSYFGQGSQKEDVLIFKVLTPIPGLIYLFLLKIKLKKMGSFGRNVISNIWYISKWVLFVILATAFLVYFLGFFV